jgi:rsbT co-antagonist protein RsbR
VAARIGKRPDATRTNGLDKEREHSMAKEGGNPLNDVLQDEAGLLQSWVERQVNAPGFRSDRTSRQEVTELSRRFLSLFAEAAKTGVPDIRAAEWANVRTMLDEVSTTRAREGFSPSETATFVFSLKEPLFERLRPTADAGPERTATWATGALLDKLGLYTTEVFQRGRDGIIIRQQQELMELSTPVVMLWEGVLALPVIGTLDSARTQIVMESLLQRIVETGSSIAIIDITGVPTVDTMTAQHLLKTVAAARLMGADCIISGIRPQIAQTIVHLGVDLGSVITKATLADAFAIALKRLGLAVTRPEEPSRRREATDPQPGSQANRGED